MPMEMALERSVGAYRVRVTGKRDELDSMLKALDETVSVLAGVKRDSTQLSQPAGFDAEIPAISRSQQLSKAVTELFNADWGINPRGISEIRDALATNGLIYPLTSLSGTLLSLTKRGFLRRIKTTDGYRYVRGASAQ